LVVATDKRISQAVLKAGGGRQLGDGMATARPLCSWLVRVGEVLGRFGVENARFRRVKSPGAAEAMLERVREGGLVLMGLASWDSPGCFGMS